jgi:hypothetical protein
MKNTLRFGSLAAIALGAALGAAPVAPTPRPANPAAVAPTTQTAATPAKLSDDEKKEGFRLLFDGVSTTGWRQLGGRPFPSGWDVQDGALHHKPRGGGGDITTDDLFENFELRFEFKIAANGNSGLKYRVVEQPNNTSALGIEYQIVDAKSASADNKNKHSLGSLYDLVDAKVTEPPPAGQWISARIIVQGNHFEHWLDGKKVAEIDYGSDAWKTAFAASKWARSNPDFASQPKGHIVLQDHTDEVWFRNIRVKELKAQ